MTLDQIRQYINYICVKENSGGTLTPEQVNVIFPAASIDIYNKTIEKAQLYALQNQVPFSRTIYEFKSMLRFRTKKNINPVVTFNGSFSFNPLNYMYVTPNIFDLAYIGMGLSNVDFPDNTYVTGKSTAGGNHILILSNNVNNIISPPSKVITFTDYSSAIYNLDVLGNYGYWLSLITNLNGKTKSIDILTDQELDDRRTNTLSVPLDEYPAAIINNNLINIYPNNITSAEFTYLRKPLTPVYDYYIDANANEVYLAVGTSHTLTTDEVGSAGQTSGTTINSTTVELDWDELFHVVFCNEVLSRVGINLKDGMVEQYINQAKQEQG